MTKTLSTPNPATAKPAGIPKSTSKSAAKPPAVKQASVKATPSKPAPKKAVAAAKVAPKGAVAPSEPKPAKPAKLRQKPVRDSFTMPEVDFALIATLKARLLAARRETKKSELLRAGLHVLAGLDTAALAATLSKLDPVKIGRPKKGH